MHRRKFFLIIIFVLLVICLYVSIAYSYYLIGNDKVEIETAMESPSCVGISIDSGNSFSLKGDYAVPITNAQFLNSKPETQDIYKYSFTITNSCEGQDLNGLTIGLVPLNGSDLPISNLKYILVKSDENTNSFTENNIKEFTDDSVRKLPKGMMQQLSNSYGESATNVYPVGSTSLSGKNSVSYDLYVWIGNNAGNETMDENFKAAVILYKEDVVIEENILEFLLKTPVGDGEIIHHTKDDSTSAGDGGYRYAGDDPNNFICFGSGSEKYNQRNDTTCPLENKYRIIGYVPVTLADGTSTSLIKVIKAEYLTEVEFIESGSYVEDDFEYPEFKRVETDLSNIVLYHWNDEANNIWNESTLAKNLNSKEYLSKAFGEYNALGDTWLDKMEKVKWNAGGNSLYGSTPKAMYEEETNGQGSSDIIDNFIGLMYNYDYGYASIKDNWSYVFDDYDDNDIGNQLQRPNNWLYNGIHEWTITRDSTSDNNVCYIALSGDVHCYGTVNEAHYALRPVFYLKSNVSIINDGVANGSKGKPFRLSV